MYIPREGLYTKVIKKNGEICNFLEQTFLFFLGHFNMVVNEEL